MSTGVMWARPDTSQNYRRGAWCDRVSLSQRVSCRSPAVSMVVERRKIVMSFLIYFDISLYRIGYSLVCSYDMYDEMVMIGEPWYGVSVVVARCPLMSL